MKHLFSVRFWKEFAEFVEDKIVAWLNAARLKLEGKHEKR